MISCYNHLTHLVIIAGAVNFKMAVSHFVNVTQVVINMIEKIQF